MAPASTVEGGASSSSSAALPRAFGNYVLFDRIGRGGMAEIFLARMTSELGGARRVVVKEILPELSQDRGFADMLVREAKLAARLNHQNVVQVLDLGRESGRLYIAMDYVEGYDLNQLLRQLSKRRLPLPAEFALLIVRETLTALDYAHRASDESGPLGIVHRDVSPSNVLISFEGEVSLCDFGIARAYAIDAENDDPALGGAEGGMSSRIQRARVAGKSAYMAPEHARGDEVDLRSDVFAAGILLWELCAGRRMYKGTEKEMLAMAREAAFNELPDRGLPGARKLRALVRRALARDPAQRFQSAAEMLEALDDYAIETRMMASQLRFGRFLTEHFAEEIVALRRSRERAAQVAFASQPPGAAREPEATGPRPAAAPLEVVCSEGAEDDVARGDEDPTSAGRAAWLWPVLALAVAATAVAAILAYR